jgi:L-iditol 2-dehydrogenase
MRQAVMTALGAIEIRAVPEPVPGRDEVLLRIVRIGVCGSDVHVYHGSHPYTGYPVVQGHEFSAVIECVGPEVRGFEPGQKVTATPQIVCGQCVPCRRGDYHICDELKVQGFQAPGFAQDLAVAEAAKLVPLPESFSHEQGALIEPLAVAVHAVQRAGSMGGKNVAVLGAGPIGNLVAQTAQAEGARVLIVDPSDFRLAVAAKCGLENGSNPRSESLSDAAKRIFGAAGLHAVFECAGNEAATDSAIRAVGKGGTIVVVGVFGEKPKVDLGLVQDRELNLVGTLMYQRSDYLRAIELVSSGGVRTDPLDTGHIPFENYRAAYELIEKQPERCMKVFIDLC